MALAILFIAYIPTLRWMVDRWTAHESYYGHGILIPLVSLFIIGKRWDLIKKTTFRPTVWGLAIVVVCLGMHLVAALLRVYFVSGFSFVCAIMGLILFFFGKDMFKNLVFPLFFLFAMVPLPLVLISNITVKLKLFAAHISTFLLNRIGFPSMRDGSLIIMPNSYIAVEAPCSGLRSLISLLTLGLVFAFAMKASYAKKGVVLLSAFPIALTGNIMRILMLAIVNDLYGEEVAMGAFHDFMGYFIFAFAFICLYSTVHVLQPKTGARGDD